MRTILPTDTERDLRFKLMQRRVHSENGWHYVFTGSEAEEIEFMKWEAEYSKAHPEYNEAE